MFRNQSPRRFTDRASTNSAIEGKKIIHHSPENKNPWPILINVPKLGSVGGAPTPKNDKVASEMIARASEMVAITRTEGTTLGKICLKDMVIGETPISLAASTYSLKLTLSSLLESTYLKKLSISCN